MSDKASPPTQRPCPPRPCPLCGGSPAGPAFPWTSQYAGESYRYFACKTCSSRYVDPVPGEAALAQMYGSGDYHEEFYDGAGQSRYEDTADRLAAHLPAGARVLDYGCGAGHLIAALKRRGFAAEGAEFSALAAANAAAKSGCRVHDLSADGWQAAGLWDAIHLGDVIEHLPEPRATLAGLAPLVAPDGLLSAQGPLEANPSLVYGAILLFSHARRLLRPEAAYVFPPYHLLFATARGQRGCLRGLPGFDEVLWQVSEDGWPYRRNGVLRGAIALAAIAVAKLPGSKLGNHYATLLRKV